MAEKHKEWCYLHLRREVAVKKEDDFTIMRESRTYVDEKGSLRRITSIHNKDGSITINNEAVDKRPWFD